MVSKSAENIKPYFVNVSFFGYLQNVLDFFLYKHDFDLGFGILFCRFHIWLYIVRCKDSVSSTRNP